MRETRVWFLGREDPLEKEMAIHSSTLAWKIPWTEEPDRLQSIGLQRVGHDWATHSLSFFIFSRVISPLISCSILCTYQPGEFIFQCPFCLFILLIGFSRQEYWSGLSFPSPVDHVLSEHPTMTHLSWVALHSMAHSFIELNKAMVHVISLINFPGLWFYYLWLCL